MHKAGYPFQKSIYTSGVTHGTFFSAPMTCDMVQYSPIGIDENILSNIELPTLALAAQFLREKGLHVYVTENFGFWQFNIDVMYEHDKLGEFGYKHADHDTAYSSGITKALTILKEIS